MPAEDPRALALDMRIALAALGRIDGAPVFPVVTV